MAILICILVFCMTGVAFTEEPWRKEILELKEIVKHQNKQLQDQLNLINKLTDEKTKLNSRMVTLEKFILGQKESPESKRNFKMAHYQETHVERRAPSTIAFHVCFSHNVANLGRVHELAYDKVHQDTHAAYEKFSGTYRVPSGGYYVFTWTTYTYTGNIPLELLVNGVVRGRSHSLSDPQTNSATGLVVIFVTVNDVVMIRTHPDFDPQGIIESVQWQESCFSGWKLS